MFGTSANWQGVHGESVAQVGVFGTSQNFVGVWGESQSDTQPGVYGTGPVIAASFQGKLLVNGSGSFTGDVEVTGDVLVGGGDCAEDFAVVEGAADFGPGTVMILTEGGALQPSQDAYDKKVAGVVSGAGDARPGLILGKEHSSENHMPLALVGSVYCKADAQYGPIEVGDLLTTSPTAGHAMRAADPLKAFGAVIGKALQSLSSGQGLVRILVALQ